MARLSSLFVRISVVFFLILLTMGLAALWVSNRNSQAYFLEFTQQLNAPIGMYMADNAKLVKDNQLDQHSLDALAAHVMVINPSLEVYLLDNDGNVVMNESQKSLNKESVDLFNPRVDLRPIQEFMKSDPVFPILGSNPLEPNEDNIFSAFPLYSTTEANGEKPQIGYVYAVLASQSHQSLISSLSGSYSLKNLVVILSGTMVLALFIGVGLFFLLTKRLRGLTQKMVSWQSNLQLEETNSRVSGGNIYPNNYLQTKEVANKGTGGEGKRADIGSKLAVNIIRNDEIDILSSTYDLMTEKLISSNQSLQERDKNRRMFFASISHDLRTPLTTMESYLETLIAKDQSIKAADRKRYLSTAHKQCIRLRRLVIQLFEFSKLTSGGVSLKSEEFSLLELCNDCLQQFSLSAEGSGIHLSIRPSNGFESVLNVMADIALIQRVLENLLGNAIKYTPQGGDVVLHLEILEDNKVRLAVCNSGEGMAKAKISRLFDSYYPQINASSDGYSSAGLGLYIVKSIVELHGSRFHIDSVQNVGTVCSFELQAA